MRDKLKQNLTTAHAALGYAITTGNGIHEASIAWDKAIDDYYALLDDEFIAKTIEICLTQWNAPFDDKNALNEFMVMS